MADAYRCHAALCWEYALGASSRGGDRSRDDLRLLRGGEPWALVLGAARLGCPSSLFLTEKHERAHRCRLQHINLSRAPRDLQAITNHQLCQRLSWSTQSVQDDLGQVEQRHPQPGAGTPRGKPRRSCRQPGSHSIQDLVTKDFTLLGGIALFGNSLLGPCPLPHVY